MISGYSDFSLHSAAGTYFFFSNLLKPTWSATSVGNRERAVGHVVVLGVL